MIVRELAFFKPAKEKTTVRISVQGMLSAMPLAALRSLSS